MMPLLKIFNYQYKKEDTLLEFVIKKKDYGDMVLYDIFFKSIFLFTISQEGKVLLANRECAKGESACFDNEIVNGINTFIMTQK